MILLRIALRNIAATKVRTFIIGLLVTFGTVLVVLGGSLLSTLELSMSKSIIGSVAGHFQLFSADAKDDLELFSPPMSTPNLGRIDNFPKVKAKLEELDEVKAVVPMGNDFAMVFTGNIMDLKLSELRKAMDSGDEERVQVVARHLRRIVSLLKDNMANLDGFITSEGDMFDTHQNLGDLDTAGTDQFWADFNSDGREEQVIFLENKISKLAMDEKMLFLRYIGTDTEAFRKNFELFEIVKGEMIPPGQRGFLFSEFMHEKQVKHQVAKRLDLAKEVMESGRTVAEDKQIQNKMAQNVRQAKDIMYQLDGPATDKVSAELRALLKTEEEDVEKLLELFLDMNDDNFHQRYDFFYEHIAPHIVLYQVPVGDTLTIRAFTRAGYSTSVNVKVYGTYRFKGLEKSALSGIYSLMDIMTFRDLYGHITDEQKDELEKLKASSGVEMLDRGSAEAEMFGGDDDLVEEDTADGFDEFAGIDMASGGTRFTEELMQHVYTVEELNGGVTTNASVILNEGYDAKKARAVVGAVIADNGLNLKVIDWREASGLVGQFIGVVWIVLVAAIFIIFLVALVIINNSMVMATLDRTREIGTMRAIGAQRRYVLKMFLLESSVLGIGFGILGVALGSAIIMVLGHVGIPAVSDELYFLFAGARLYPILMPSHLVVAFGVVFLISLASTLYPARLAARIQPVKAMGKED